ncbi:FHA domain-containing protein [Cronbergia sp. UHCC 0137]|uniref:FHA domain-containing protein n=1 Tax=Cronbergia sp. UHCC 0137 TaxID=3110239 RepID=UPI002B214B8C|nr:FHA domain-containing protein [Cronbergia sp. UHCC 0137]MEA5617343.1 FHA domain-containing protein [Cronbergia sp. UHCC 0137]
MIVCPNCNHPNPDGAVQCEACYTPLPATTQCPSCGASVQADAAFCGQCGFNLHSNVAVVPPTPVAPTIAADLPIEVPPLVIPDPMLELLEPDPFGISTPVSSNLPPTIVTPEPEPVAVAVPESVAVPEPIVVPEPVAVAVPEPEPVAVAVPEPVPVPQVVVARTQLQQVTGRLFHVQSNQDIELPQNFSVIHIGKPNDRIPPDIDVAGFPNAEIVSRIHADIRIEGDAYYIEDVGSSNGTYINNLPLLPGNRHRLRPGDRITLGKGDLVTFLFQLS